MYIGYLQDRKLLGYLALKDTSCGIKLLLITDSTRLADPSLYRERLKSFRNRESLPETYVEEQEHIRDLIVHVRDPDTIIILGTLGANRETNGELPKIQGYHLYNDRNGFNAFFDKNKRLYRPGFEANRSQKIDVKTNSNMM